MKIKALIISCLAGILVAGCGAAGQEIDKDASAKAVGNAQMARQIFDATGGKFEAVSEADKAKLKEAYGGEAGVQKLWASMTNPPVGGGSAMPPGAPVTPGGN